MHIHDVTLADQDRIGMMIFKNFADQDWTRTKKFHSPLISDRQWLKVRQWTFIFENLFIRCL